MAQFHVPTTNTGQDRRRIEERAASFVSSLLVLLFLDVRSVGKVLAKKLYANCRHNQYLPRLGIFSYNATRRVSYFSDDDDAQEDILGQSSMSSLDSTIHSEVDIPDKDIMVMWFS